MQQLINIDVPDLEAALRFYTRAFGLHAGRRLGGEVVELLGGQAPMYLLRKPEGSAAAGSDTRRYARHWSPLHVDAVVEDLDAALASALQAGARQEGEIRSANWGRIVQIADPFGHGWCLLQFLGRGYDEIAD
ncbi:VOC family protein [Lysobacter sp. CA199]|uniref:VOC family protein n=1 Tax=Lysobacter sp. CA199 TaxID=3455608 RepID=UPI003F8D4FDA